MLIVVKYGGNAMGDLAADPVLADCARHALRGDRIVIVHGGGPAIDRALTAAGISDQRVDGLRVTGRAALDVVESVLCATVNKALVRALLALGVSAVGVSCQDGALLRARALAPIRGQSLGYVGQIESVDTALIEALLDRAFLPVIAPLALSQDGKTAMNCNADTAAGAIAGALRADAFIAITDVSKIRRVLSDPASAVDHLDAQTIEQWRGEGALSGGMLPKVDAALRALQSGAARSYISGSADRPIALALGGGGTEISLR